MGKKNTGGKNFKKQKKVSNVLARELIYRDNEQSYGRIVGTLGDSRFQCECFELGLNLIAHVRGSFKRKIWMGIGDIVLISFRDFDKTKCDIIHKYTFEEAIMLKTLEEIPSRINLYATKLDIDGENDNFVTNDLNVDFEEI